MKNLELNAYKIQWALFINKNNEMNLSKSFFAPNLEMLKEKLVGKKGTYYIITDKQVGLIQNRCDCVAFHPNTPLSIHKEVLNVHGSRSFIPMTKNQFNNPIVIQ
jgi:hypothetical protein